MFYCCRWYVLVGANNISLNSEEEWTEKRIAKIYKHPKFDNFEGASYYDVAVIGKHITFLVYSFWGRP